ncbi:glutathione S-transferase [Acrasis kona]|uniref:Glutathione S-transferase n=1 Tax=Acrasis kona TaxID=1008807 RepID=A0AAW2Z546_9EUKA
MTYTLHYFNVRGRGELSRLILEFGKIDYVNDFIKFEQWAERKKTIKYGKLPYVTSTNGFELYESMAIARFFAKKGGLYPEDAEKAAITDMWSDKIYDFYSSVTPIIYRTPKDQQAEKIKTVLSESAPAFFDTVEAALNEDGHFLEKLTWSDLYLFVVTTVDFLKPLVDSHPKVSKLVEEIKNSEVYKNYQNSDRCVSF